MVGGSLSETHPRRTCITAALMFDMLSYMHRCLPCRFCFARTLATSSCCRVCAHATDEVSAFFTWARATLSCVGAADGRCSACALRRGTERASSISPGSTTAVYESNAASASAALLRCSPTMRHSCVLAALSISWQFASILVSIRAPPFTRQRNAVNKFAARARGCNWA